MSDVFLPGSFKHVITYIGTVEQRRKTGLTDSVLKQAAISDRQRDELLARVVREKTEHGDEINVIEAVSEGVIMNSLDYLLATHINRMLVVRPKISKEERTEQLVSLLQCMGTGYDFKFDFVDPTYQCCTELVYRTLNGKGTLEFPLTKLKGIWILDADGIVRYASPVNPEAFDLVLLTDTAFEEENYSAVVCAGTEGAKMLMELLSSGS